MAKINVFEGSRRLALLLKLVWLIGVAGVTWSTIPSSVYIHFVTEFPTEPFRMVTDNCRSGTDALEFVSRDIGEGRTAQVQLCFEARRSDEGRQVVPYKVDANGTWWGNGPYTTDVSAYTDQRAEAFVLSKSDQSAAHEEFSSRRLTHIRDGALIAVGGWIVLSLIQMLVGWIVRGFLGIRWGQDRRTDIPPKVENA